eukprot:gene26855-biopygen5503
MQTTQVAHMQITQVASQRLRLRYVSYVGYVDYISGIAPILRRFRDYSVDLRRICVNLTSILREAARFKDKPPFITTHVTCVDS